MLAFAPSTGGPIDVSTAFDGILAPRLSTRARLKRVSRRALIGLA